MNYWRLILQSKESKILDQKTVIKKMKALIEIQRTKLDLRVDSDKKFVVKPIPKIVVEDTTRLRLIFGQIHSLQKYVFSVTSSNDQPRSLGSYFSSRSRSAGVGLRRQTVLARGSERPNFVETKQSRSVLSHGSFKTCLNRERSLGWGWGSINQSICFKKSDIEYLIEIQLLGVTLNHSEEENLTREP